MLKIRPSSLDLSFYMLHQKAAGVKKNRSKPMTRSQSVNIADLQAYLERIAWKLSYKYGEDHDDLLQVMNLEILEQAEKNPTFLDQTRAYICNKAAWAARNFCRSDLRGQNHGHDRAAFSLDQDNDDGTDPAETIAAETPDQDVRISVQDALASLSETTQLVAKLMMEGYKGEALAEHAGLNSKAAVGYHRRLIKQALTGLV
jgi:DNA-directed RNA polymerase specialized sigma24 family protein